MDTFNMPMLLLAATALMGKIIPIVSGSFRTAILGSGPLWTLPLSAVLFPIGLLLWGPVFWVGIAFVVLHAILVSLAWVLDIMQKWGKFNPCDLLCYIPILALLVVEAGWISYAVYVLALALHVAYLVKYDVLVFARKDNHSRKGGLWFKAETKELHIDMDSEE